MLLGMNGVLVKAFMINRKGFSMKHQNEFGMIQENLPTLYAFYLKVFYNINFKFKHLAHNLHWIFLCTI